jgi:hypothetical protein
MDKKEYGRGTEVGLMEKCGLRVSRWNQLEVKAAGCRRGQVAQRRGANADDGRMRLKGKAAVWAEQAKKWHGEGVLPYEADTIGLTENIRGPVC